MKRISYLSLWLLFLSVIWEVAGAHSVDTASTHHSAPYAQITPSDVSNAQALGIAPVLYYLKHAVHWLTLICSEPEHYLQAPLPTVPVESQLNTYLTLITYQHYQSSLDPFSLNH